MASLSARFTPSISARTGASAMSEACATVRSRKSTPRRANASPTPAARPARNDSASTLSRPSPRGTPAVAGLAICPGGLSEPYADQVRVSELSVSVPEDCSALALGSFLCVRNVACASVICLLAASICLETLSACCPTTVGR